MSAVLAGCVAATGLAALAQTEEADEPILDERGYLTCAAFSRMSPGLQSAFLMGLREGWHTASSGLDAHAGREDLVEHRESLQAGALWMRRMIDHGGATYGRVLERTRSECQEKPQGTAWKAWLDSVRQERSATAGE